MKSYQSFLILFLFSLPLLATSQAPPQKISFKVNLGGEPVGDFLGEEQALDMSAFSKNVVRSPIQNTDQPEVFQSQRFARASDFTVRIPVPDGVYSVTLLFAETFMPACVPGARVFDISIGTPVSGVTKVIEGFDVFQAAGCNAAHGKRFDGVPSKEGIVVHLSRRAQHPSLAGFIVEGFPVVKGDGSEYKAIAQAPPVTGEEAGIAMPGVGGVPGGVDPSLNTAVGAEAPPSAMGDLQPAGSALGMAMPASGAVGDVGVGGDPAPAMVPMVGRDAIGATGPSLGLAPSAPQIAYGIGAAPGMEAPQQAAPAGGMAPGMGSLGGVPFSGRRRLLHAPEEEVILAEYGEGIVKDGQKHKAGSRRLNGIEPVPKAPKAVTVAKKE